MVGCLFCKHGRKVTEASAYAALCGPCLSKFALLGLLASCRKGRTENRYVGVTPPIRRSKGRRVATHAADMPIPGSIVDRSAKVLVSYKKSSSLKNLIANGVRTIVAIHAMLANPSMAATSIFCFFGVCRSLTMNIGMRPKVQSAMAFNKQETKVVATTISSLKHLPYSLDEGGACFCIHHALIG